MNVTAILPRLDYATYGGLMAFGRTPIGCTLYNGAAADQNRSAWHYMRDVKTIDTLSCRARYVLLVTDGQWPWEASMVRAVEATPWAWGGLAPAQWP